MFNDWPWRHWRETRGEAAAIRLGEETLNWRELCARIDALAAGFAQQQVKPDDAVMLRASNNPQTLLVWLALWQCGARVLHVNPQLPAALVNVLIPQLSLQHTYCPEGEKLNAGLNALTFRQAAGECAAPWQPERFASMTLTSGSTGLPKAAVHTFAAHLASAKGVLSLMAFAPGDDWLLSLPLFHVSGLGIIWRWLLAGARLTVREKQPLAQALQGCTHASLVPTQLWRLLEEGAPVDLSAVLLGGAQIPVELTTRAAARGIRTWCGYGLTEFASTVCAKPADGAPDVGYALPGREVRIVEGEVWLRGESMAAGYWRNGALSPLVNDAGWFATRDRGVLNDGRLTIAGRMDNLFFCGGEGVQPEEVERVIVAHPYVQQVFIVPVEDKEFGQRPVAVVECETSFNVGTLADWVRGRLARFQQPVHWLILPDSLKTGGIKISRKSLGDWVLQTLRAQ